MQKRPKVGRGRKVGLAGVWSLRKALGRPLEYMIAWDPSAISHQPFGKPNPCLIGQYRTVPRLVVASPMQSGGKRAEREGNFN